MSMFLAYILWHMACMYISMTKGENMSKKLVDDIKISIIDECNHGIVCYRAVLNYKGFIYTTTRYSEEDCIYWIKQTFIVARNNYIEINRAA